MHDELVRLRNRIEADICALRIIAKNMQRPREVASVASAVDTLIDVKAMVMRQLELEKKSAGAA